MTDLGPRVIELREYETCPLPAAALTAAQGEALWRRHGDRVEVEFPTVKTADQWRLRSLGWVGHIPLDQDLALHLGPKVPLANLFRLLEYAYSLGSFHILDGLARCDSLQDLYERLAHLLAQRVLGRGRRGFYRAYLDRQESLPFLRGRLDLRSAARQPWTVRRECLFDEQTADIADNQILLWTLSRIAASQLCSDRVQPVVRRAYRQLLGCASVQAFNAAACVNRLYNRLNDDYQALHGLCRFFLEHTGPGHRVGDRTMVPFLVDMARLFELFVARWLALNAGDDLLVRAQAQVNLGESRVVSFVVDIVLEDRATGRPLCVVDTKYKQAESPDPADVAQVVTYALTKGCSNAVLAYPVMPRRPLDEVIGGIRVRTLAFPLDGDIEQAGRSFLAGLRGSTTAGARIA